MEILYKKTQLHNSYFVELNKSLKCDILEKLIITSVATIIIIIQKNVEII